MVVQGSITPGDLAGFVMYSFLIAGNLSSLSSLYGDMVRAVAASNRIFDVLDRQPSIPSGLEQQQQDSSDEDDPLVPVTFTTATTNKNSESKNTDKLAPFSVEIKNLSFAYPTRPDVQVLNDLNLSIHPGQVFALVGGSGSGKSTTASLLTRLYDANAEQDGSIFLNEKDIRDYNVGDLRRHIGVVSQEPLLFQGSIMDNIRYGEWDDVSDDKVMEAADLAHVTTFAKTFPEGMNTMVGPRGTALSGGQKQRVALARVFVKNPSLVILDEATSALDAQSENLVQQAMESIKEGRTVLSIAHRLSTIRQADMIAVLDKGSIVQQGTFDELSSQPGPFLDLMKTQLVPEKQ